MKNNLIYTIARVALVATVVTLCIACLFLVFNVRAGLSVSTSIIMSLLLVSVVILYYFLPMFKLLIYINAHTRNPDIEWQFDYTNNIHIVRLTHNYPAYVTIPFNSTSVDDCTNVRLMLPLWVHQIIDLPVVATKSNVEHDNPTSWVTDTIVYCLSGLTKTFFIHRIRRHITDGLLNQQTVFVKLQMELPV